MSELGADKSVLIDGLEEVVRKNEDAGVLVPLLLLLLTEPEASDSDELVTVSSSAAGELLARLAEREEGNLVIRAALERISRFQSRDWERPTLRQKVAQLASSAVWRNHAELGCPDRRDCPLTAVAHLASVEYLDLEQSPWLPQLLVELVAEHSYRSSTFSLFKTLSVFPVRTDDVRRDMFDLLRTIEESSLPEMIGVSRRTHWREVLDRLTESSPLSQDEYKVLRRLGNRLIAAGDTGVIGAHLDLLDQHEPSTP